MRPILLLTMASLGCGSGLDPQWGLGPQETAANTVELAARAAVVETRLWLASMGEPKIFGATAAEVAEAARFRAGQTFGPSDCLSVSRSNSFDVLTLSGCNGPSGLTALKGQLSVNFIGSRSDPGGVAQMEFIGAAQNTVIDVILAGGVEVAVGAARGLIR